jgi:hypothetical protein
MSNGVNLRPVSVFGAFTMIGMLNRLAFYLLPANVLIDTLLLFSEQLSWLPMLRAGLLLALLIYVFARFSGHFKHYSFVVLFLAYCLLQLLFVTDLAKSLNITLKVCIPIASFAVGFHLFNKVQELRRLSISIVWVFFILIFNFTLSQLLGLGNAVYSDDSSFRVGNLDDSWNVFTYSVLLTPLILYFVQRNSRIKIITYIGAFVNAALVLVSIKRIAILGLVTGTLVRWYYALRIRKIVQSLLVFTLVISVAYFLFGEFFEKRIQARSDRFEAGALEREGRFLESQYVWEEILSFENAAKSLFGLEGFYSVGNYADGRFGDRQLHVDFNLMANTIGVLGLVLYLAMFIQIANRMRYYSKRCNLESGFSKLIISIFWMLLLNQFITSFAGQMYHVSYRLIVFVFMGSILGIVYRSSYAHSTSMQRK